jgi:hypothetical protein
MASQLRCSSLLNRSPLAGMAASDERTTGIAAHARPRADLVTFQTTNRAPGALFAPDVN